MNIIPVKPKLNSLEGYAQAGVQNYDGYSGEAALNIPLGSMVAVRASGQVVNRNGYISDGTGDDIHESARLQLLFAPSDDVSLRLWYAYTHQGGKGPGYVVYDPYGSANGPVVVPHNAWTSFIPTLNATLEGINSHIPSPVPFFKLFDASQIRQSNKIWEVHAQLDWKLGGLGTLTLIPAYQKANLRYTTMPTNIFTGVGLDGKPWSANATSVEARLAGEAGAFKWLLGGFYYKEHQDWKMNVNFGFVNNLYQDEVFETKSGAVFGQGTFSITDALRLIGGIRYSSERKNYIDFTQYSAYPSNNCPVPGTGPGGSCLDASIPLKTYSAKPLNYKVGFEADLGPQNMVYASISDGFKAGGQSIANVPPYRAEKVTAYTIGSKNKFADGRITLNAELFYMDYTDHQEQLITVVGNSINQVVLNAGRGTSKGASIDFSARPTDQDEVRVAVEYLDASYKTFTYQAYQAFVSTGCATSIDPTVPPGPFGNYITINCGGMPMTRAPKWSGSARYAHTFKLNNGAAIEAGIDGSAASKRWLHATYIANSLAPSYAQLNANLTFYSPDGHLMVQGFVRNITNAKNYTGGEQAAQDPGFFAAIIAPPRTYGLRVRYDF